MRNSKSSLCVLLWAVVEYHVCVVLHVFLRETVYHMVSCSSIYNYCNYSGFKRFLYVQFVNFDILFFQFVRVIWMTLCREMSFLGHVTENTWFLFMLLWKQEMHWFHQLWTLMMPYYYVFIALLANLIRCWNLHIFTWKLALREGFIERHWLSCKA